MFGFGYLEGGWAAIWALLGLGGVLGALGAVLEASWRVLEASWALLGRSGGILGALGAVLEASWALLGRSWRPLGRSWACLGRSWDGLGGILRAKRLPKRSPGGSQIGSRRRLELKRAKSQNFEDVSRNSLIFKVPGLRFWDQNWTKTVFESQLKSLEAS